jgi:hypothetical protein
MVLADRKPLTISKKGGRTMFKSKMLIVAPLVLFCIIGASAKSCVSHVPQTGQTACYDKSGKEIGCEEGSDGYLQRGLPWPNPRFTDNGNGTVTDNLTELIWLKDASRFGTRTCSHALDDCNNLADDGYDLTDGSVAGDWRLPNVRELNSLIHYGFYDPALPDTAGTGKWSEGDPFNNVPSKAFYWSSTTYAGYPTLAWGVSMHYGSVYYDLKDHDTPYVWPVRGGNW